MTQSKPTSIQIVISLFAVITLLEVINLVSGRMLNQFAILPRETSHLSGIVISPFLHGSLWHYLSNIVPVCLFSYFLLQWGKPRYFTVSAFIIVVTGLLVWLLGRSAFHLGASGLIYGYFGFLLVAGFLSKKPRLILISIVVGFFYGGMIFGVLPLKSFISWESHLFGLLSGFAAAMIWAKPEKQ